jgi:quinol monooxygenase YgiN
MTPMCSFYTSYVDAEALAAHKNSEHYQYKVVRQIIPYLETRNVVIVAPDRNFKERIVPCRRKS